MKLAYDLRKSRKNGVCRAIEDLPFAAFDVNFQNQVRCAELGMFHHEIRQRRGLRRRVDRDHLSVKMEERMARWRPFDRVIELLDRNAGLRHGEIPAVVAGDSEGEGVGYAFEVVDLNISAVALVPNSNFLVIDDFLGLKQTQDSENFALLCWP